MVFLEVVLKVNDKNKCLKHFHILLVHLHNDINIFTCINDSNTKLSYKPSLQTEYKIVRYLINKAIFGITCIT